MESKQAERKAGTGRQTSLVHVIWISCRWQLRLTGSHPHTHTVRAAQSPAGSPALYNKSPFSYYSGLSRGCGVLQLQQRGSACSRLVAQSGLKSGSFFKQLPLDMDDEAANAWIMAIKQITSSLWLTCSAQFKPISSYPPSLSLTLSAHLYIWLESITTFPGASQQMWSLSTPRQHGLWGFHHGGLTRYSVPISGR